MQLDGRYLWYLRLLAVGVALLSAAQVRAVTPKARMVRPVLTDAEWKALRYLAIDREQTMSDLVTVALQTSPHTRKAFQTKETKQ